VLAAGDPECNYCRSMQSLPSYLTINETADLLRCSVRHIYNMAARHDFPTMNLGRRVVIPRAKLEAWIEAHSTPAPKTKARRQSK
jgi:excisionase family DNA binding protein